ncbi:MAG TPA: NAD(P)H-dependent oxidoreductase [Rhodoglobus sp.]|nr:NAD(P)H-dependent oxidoreductase [Rhodoglobus sp.]
MALTALALICTLKPSPQESSTELIASQVLEQLAQQGVTGSSVRVVDHDVKPGVTDDEGDGDAWPAIREQVLATDILVLATPTWMGQLSSIAMRVLERLDNELGVTDDDNRPILFGKVAIAAVVGNEDGAHHISSQLFQALNDTGYTIPAQGVTYWNGEAMQATDYRDVSPTPEKTAATNATVAKNAAHLAGLLQNSNYPA